MTRRRRLASKYWLSTLAWLVLLSVLPWWLGLPMLLALAAALLLLPHRLVDEHAELLRGALSWGLPGLLFALQRALGGGLMAWGAALLGALIGYTLLAGLEAWLDRHKRRAPATWSSPEWPELAQTPIGPAAEIIELQPLQWQHVNDVLDDPLLGQLTYRDDGFQLADGRVIRNVDPQLSFSPAARWLAATIRSGRGTVLWDRQGDRHYRLDGWKLSGWYREQPWLARREQDMPQALSMLVATDSGHDD